MIAAVLGIGVLLVTIAGVSLVRATRRLGAETVLAPGHAPAVEPKSPRDTSRPYPRPKGHRSGLNRVCPVCGTGKETGDLDRRVLGWPAHRSCAEWLGDWEPERRDDPGPIPVEPAWTQSGTDVSSLLDPLMQDLPGPVIAIAGQGTVAVSPEAAEEMVRRGLISVDEARSRLDREIISVFGVPPVTWSAAGDRPPLSGTAAWEWHCRCGRYGRGMSADGPAAEAAGRDGLAAHRGPAQCERFGEYTWRYC